MDRAGLDAYGRPEVPTACGIALDWLDLDEDEHAETMAGAPDDIRERIEAANYFFATAAEACRFQAHIKQSGKSKLPWRYRWPDEILARLRAFNAQRAELERLTGLPSTTARDSSPPSPADTAASDSASGPAKRKTTKRAAKKPSSQPLFDNDRKPS